MSDIEKLKKLDPQEVHKRTYIAPKVLQALLEGDFAKLGNRTKALGFVAILERELELDLSELREKIDEFYGVHQESSVFEIKEKEEKGGISWLWGAVVFLAVAAAGYYFYANAPKKEPDSFLVVENNTTKEENSTSQEQNSSSDPQQQSTMAEKNESSEFNNSADANSSLRKVAEVNESNESTQEVNETQQPEADVPQTLTFIPKKKLWLGIIYLDDYSRKNYVTSSPIEINTSRDQLIVTGHGLFEIEHNNKIEDFKDRGKQRFIYRAGELEKIDATTFRRYNRGKDW